jgi:O-antigen/teichoic acid export membrane protein
MVTALPLRLPGIRMLKDVGTTYVGFLANAIMSFVSLKLMGNYLGPGGFGVAMLANTFMSVIAGLGEPGLGTALVRLAARPAMTPRGVDRLVVAAIRLKILLVTGLCAATYVLMPWITGAFMHRPELTLMLRCCLGGGAMLSLATFAGSLFQIRSAFRENAAAIAVAGAARTVVVAGLWLTGRLNLWTAVASLILMNVVQCGVCALSLREMLCSLPWNCHTGRQIREITQYGKYLVIWLLAGTIHPRADTLLLTHYASDNRTLGFYSAATQLSLVALMLTTAINLVLLPRISALRSPGEMRSALRQCGLSALAVILLLGPLSLAAGPIVHLVFRISYEPAVLPFRVLLWAAAVDVALNPFSNFWHPLDRPAMLSYFNVLRLSLLVGTATLAIPRWGSLGAAAAVLVSTAISLGAQAVALWMVIAGQAAAQSRPRTIPFPVDVTLADP